MTELETLERAKMYMEKLANGINPIDGSVIPDEDVVNNVRLSRCFFYVADVLRQVIENGGVVSQKSSKKEPFALSAEERAGFAFADDPLTISEIVKRINDLVTDENMTKLTAPMVTEWLVNIGVLFIEMNAEGKNVKRPSPQGISIGISVEARTSMNGPYSAVIYNRDAQQFVIDNLDAALDMYREKTENQGQPWSPEHDRCLLDLHQKGVPMREIAVTLKRNAGSVRARLKKLGASA